MVERIKIFIMVMKSFLSTYMSIEDHVGTKHAEFFSLNFYKL